MRLMAAMVSVALAAALVAGCQDSTKAKPAVAPATTTAAKPVAGQITMVPAGDIKESSPQASATTAKATAAATAADASKVMKTVASASAVELSQLQPAQNAAVAKRPPLTDPNFFPITVWLQSPRNAEKYKAIGINTYIGLYNGPTEEHLAALKKAGMYVICEQNAVALKHLDDDNIIAWMHGDEPDNAQSMKDVWKNDVAAVKKAWPESGDKTLEQWGSYGPPIPPSTIIADYHKLKAADPSRPVILNLGQGVAWEGWHGRGYRSGKLEDYPEYIKGCDMVSFDIYPANHDKPELEGKLELVAKGVDRLVKWGNGQKPAWDCIECTAMGGPEHSPTPSQVKSEVWMSIIHGSKGLVYFVHIFKPKFIEAGVLESKEMCDAITAINKQVAALAPVINSPNVDAATVTSGAGEAAPIDIMVKQKDGATYLFAADMRNVDTKGTFQVKGLKGKATVEVLGEDRKIEATDGQFTDDFKGYATHIYKVTK